MKSEKEEQKFSREDAQRVGGDLGVDWDEIDLDQFHAGLNVELEHGTIDPDTNITDDDPAMTGKIAWVHLKEVPDYYVPRLADLEREGKAREEGSVGVEESLSERLLHTCRGMLGAVSF